MIPGTVVSPRLIPGALLRRRTEKGAIDGGFPTGLLDCTQLKRLHLSNAGDSAFAALPAEISRLQVRWGLPHAAGLPYPRLPGLRNLRQAACKSSRGWESK